MKTVKMLKKIMGVVFLAMCSAQMFAQDALAWDVEGIQEFSKGNWKVAESKFVQADKAYDKERYESLYGESIRGFKMDLYSPISHVDVCVKLAIARCNIHAKKGAIQAMEKAVYLIKNSPTLSANNSHELAEKFLSKLRSSSVDFTFTPEEAGRIDNLLIAAPYANFEKNHREYMSRMNAIIGYCETRLQYYQKEMDRTSRQAINTAAFEYHKNTGSDFDPNEKPSAGTRARTEWDYCNKIHQIFK